MSGLVVVVDRTGDTVPDHIVEAVTEAVAHRGPDGVTVERDGGVAMVHAALRATPESRFERQPLQRSDGTWLVADLRLDNRRRLIDRLGRIVSGRTPSDIDLLAEAHDRWGDRVVDQLIGDFAAVVLEPGGRLTCIRDQLGIKPLYYWCSGRWIVVASGLREISAHPDAPRSPDLSMLGQYLSGWVEDPVATVVAGVDRLPGGHIMTIAPNGEPVTRRYWAPPRADPIGREDLTEYRDRFRQDFTEAVRCRLRIDGGAGCELSGGLDSTSVAATAQKLIGNGDVPADKLATFSCMFPGSPLADEQTHIDSAVTALGLTWEPVVSRVDRSPWVEEDVRFWSDIPLPPDGPDHVALARAAADAGCPVVLTGHGGDNWFDASPVALAALTYGRQPAEAWRVAMRWAEQHRTSAAVMLATYGLGSFKPEWIHRPGVARAPWVAGAPRSAAELDRRRIAGSGRPVHRNPLDQHRHQTATDGYEAMTKEILDRIAAAGGVEARHPYSDLRVVELASRAPITAHVNRQQDRALQRAGLRDLLPAETADRESKASFNEIWFREIRRQMPGSPSATRPGRLGWLDELEAIKILEATEARIEAGSGGGHLFALWGIVQVDALLGHLENPIDPSAT